ncbi:MAG: hypothetical protein J6R88_05855 [Clostridia bacterium]|nr:hypothetical protein [Clostridia bacterium]
MLKKLLTVIAYVLLIFIFGFNATPLFANECVVSVSSSSGTFYKTTHYGFDDAFLGNGVCKFYDANYNYNKFVIEYYNAEVVDVSEVDGYATNYYYYSDMLPNAEIINGKKVNVHIAVTNERVVIGYPLIYYYY